MRDKKWKEGKEMDAMERGEMNAFMGGETFFEGKLSYTGAVRLDGRFKGEIQSDDTLIIGETARIEGEVHVGTAIIQGEIVGNVYAKERVELHHPGRMIGDITTPSVVIDDGAVFEGKCKMKEKKEDKKGQKKEKEKEKDDKGIGIFAQKQETEPQTEDKTKETSDQSVKAS
jgi:cytoskeletal protein CcmA (bactofilin family)